MVGRCKVVFYVHDMTHILKELLREAPDVVRYEFFRKTIVEHGRIYEMLGDFGRREPLFWECIGQLGIQIYEH